jgi:thiol-disulfide isomerase/thioredoxin
MFLFMVAVSLGTAPARAESPGTEVTTRIRGRVCTPEGKPVPGLIIKCFRFNPQQGDDFVREVDKQVSDENGRYAFRVRSGDQYRVEVPEGKSTFAASKRILARPDAESDVEDLVVRPATARLKGRLLRREGTPAANVEFACWSPNFCPFVAWSMPKTDDQGWFDVPGVLPGEEVTFWAVADVNQIQFWTGIRPDTQSLEFRLNPREYVAMPPQWKRYSDAEAFARDTLWTRVARRIDFTLPDLQGRPVSLSSERFKGKVVLVNFFGSWCGGCRIEIPHLVRLKEKYGAEGLEIVGLAFEREPEAGKAELRKLLEEAKVNYIVLFGGPTPAEHVSATVKGIARFRGYPTTILLGREGQVKYTEVGIKAETKARTDWWSTRLEKRIVGLLKSNP